MLERFVVDRWRGLQTGAGDAPGAGLRGRCRARQDGSVPPVAPYHSRCRVGDEGCCEKWGSSRSAAVRCRGRGAVERLMSSWGLGSGRG
jgi:hypothetical protein